jgi:hypothetical protein
MIKVLSNHKKQLDSYRGNVRNHVSVHDGVVILIFANRRRGWQFSFFIGGEIRRQPYFIGSEEVGEEAEIGGERGGKGGKEQKWARFVGKA